LGEDDFGKTDPANRVDAGDELCGSLCGYIGQENKQMFLLTNYNLIDYDITTKICRCGKIYRTFYL